MLADDNATKAVEEPLTASPRRLFNPVRAMLRGFAVLEAINALRCAELSDIVRATGLPRTTVIRLIETLEEGRYIVKDPHTGAYEPTPRVMGLASGLNMDAWLVSITTPVLRDLLRKIGWPSDVSVLQGERMALRNSNRAYSALNIDRHYAGMTSSLTEGASGRAFLTWCGKEQRQKLLEMTTKVADRQKVLHELELTRERGYAIRSAKTQPFLGAIAIPVLAPEAVVCCLTCVFLPQTATVTEVAERCLPHLREAAGKISAMYVQQFADPLGVG